MPHSMVEDLVQDALTHFYRYQYERFDMEYGEKEFLEKRAKSFMYDHIFKYLAEKSFYGKKIRTTIKAENYSSRNTESMSNTSDNLFYGIKDSNKNGSEYVCNLSLSTNKYNEIKKDHKVSISLDQKIYLDQFTNYVQCRIRIRKVTKQKLLNFLYSNDISDLGTNVYYYKKLINRIKGEFDNINRSSLCS
jgi:hypothetical protein